MTYIFFTLNISFLTFFFSFDDSSILQIIVLKKYLATYAISIVLLFLVLEVPVVHSGVSSGANVLPAYLKC